MLGLGPISAKVTKKTTRHYILPDVPPIILPKELSLIWNPPNPAAILQETQRTCWTASGMCSQQQSHCKKSQVKCPGFSTDQLYGREKFGGENCKFKDFKDILKFLKMGKTKLCLEMPLW